jgi:hypothetical protein
MTETNIRITGVRQTIAALKAFTPGVEKVLGEQIREALAATQRAAQGIYPRGSWVIGRNRKKLLGYIAARAGGGGGGKSWGAGPAGRRAGIFEFIGSSYGGDRPQVLSTIASLNSRYGQPGRFLWSAWDQTGKQVLDDIKVAVQGAERELQARLDSIGDVY